MSIVEPATVLSDPHGFHGGRDRDRISQLGHGLERNLFGASALGIGPHDGVAHGGVTWIGRPDWSERPPEHVEIEGVGLEVDRGTQAVGRKMWCDELDGKGHAIEHAGELGHPSDRAPVEALRSCCFEVPEPKQGGGRDLEQLRLGLGQVGFDGERRDPQGSLAVQPRCHSTRDEDRELRARRQEVLDDRLGAPDRVGGVVEHEQQRPPAEEGRDLLETWLSSTPRHTES